MATAATPVTSVGLARCSSLRFGESKTIFGASLGGTGTEVLVALGGTWLYLKGQNARRQTKRCALPTAPLAVAAVGGAVLVAAAVTVTRRSKPAKPPEPKPIPDMEDAKRQIAEELRPVLPTSLEEALKDFEGDFSGPWHALGLEATDPSVTIDEIRLAYRQAVRLEHPDTSDSPDAEERFQRVRKAYALLSDEGSRELLMEAIEQEATSFEELSGYTVLEESDEGKTASSFPWCLFLFLAVLGMLVLAVVNLSPEMKLRPVPKEPAIYLLDTSKLQS